jgi:hypothetical protein
LDDSSTRPYTASQIVAHNFWWARTRLRGWSQDLAAEKLAPYVGARWTKSNVSALEGSMYKGDRRVDVDDLLAFARAFELPVVWFLLPPPNASAIVGGEPSRKRGTPPAHPVEQQPMAPADLVGLLLGGHSPGLAPDQLSGSEVGWAELFERLAELPPAFLSAAMRTQAMTVESFIRAAFEDTSHIERTLLDLAAWFGGASIFADEQAARLAGGLYLRADAHEGVTPEPHA